MPFDTFRLITVRQDYYLDCNFTATSSAQQTMKLKTSILKIYSIIFLISCVGYTIYNYDQLSEGEGWGVVGMVGLFGFGVLLFVGDIVVRNLIKNKTTANIIGLVVSIIATLLLIYGGFFS